MDYLSQLATKYGSDKAPNQHNFTPFYDLVLSPRVDEVEKVIEVGILGGSSLRMWRDYFPYAEIHGYDIDPNTFIVESRVTCAILNQLRRRELNMLVDSCEHAKADLFIDDGCHIHEAQQLTLYYGLQCLKPGGVFILEDIHTSFGNDWGEPSGSPHTTAVILEQLIAGKFSEISTKYLSQSQIGYIISSVERIYLIDNGTDHQHMSAILWRT